MEHEVETDLRELHARRQLSLNNFQHVQLLHVAVACIAGICVIAGESGET